MVYRRKKKLSMSGDKWKRRRKKDGVE